MLARQAPLQPGLRDVPKSLRCSDEYGSIGEHE
jgi:hypothetical protein